MKTFILLLVILSTNSWAAVSLKVGDILLQPTDCWSCSLIEAEEETIYSHIGIVLQVSPEVLVAEALGKVRLVSLAEFHRKTQKDQSVAVLRYSNSKLADHIETNSSELMTLFKAEFEHLSYDHDFRWNNLDPSGKEKLYCSEFVGKLLQAFVGLESPIKRMHFKKNPDQWFKYFKGNVPDGLWGNSPADFERSEKFYIEGDL